MISRTMLLASSLLVLPNLAWSRVLLRWTADNLPPAKRLGVAELVIAWNDANLKPFQVARDNGYRVYAEASPDRAAAAADSAAKSGVVAVIINPGDNSPESLAPLLRKLRARHPKVKFLIENPNALQPKMRGTLVINRNGVLQATSPTAQPWIDTNLALVRMEQAFRPAQPPLYRFAWDLNGTGKLDGPAAPDYALAIAEAGAFHADLILSLPESLQLALLKNDSAAWDLWGQNQKYLNFYSDHARQLGQANIAVIADDDPSSFEPVNLLVRHNLDVRVIPPAKFSDAAIHRFDVLVFLSPPAGNAVATITRFARQGGTVVLLNTDKKNYPWHSIQATSTTASSTSYSLGSGRVIELLQAINDPEAFAQDVRALVPEPKRCLSLWNALTVIGLLDDDGKGRSIELLNYAGDPLQVQVRVKGSYKSLRYETPEHGCCTELQPSIEDGFTEFTVPSLAIAGRVRLGTANSSDTQTRQPRVPARP